MAKDESAVIRTKFDPNPVQHEFIKSQATADLFSSRMGEGKSAALVWSVFWHCRHNPGARWAVIRDTWENMQATTLQEFFKWFPPGIYGTWNASERKFSWSAGGMEGLVYFLGMDAPDDASKLQSRELAGFAIDEPAPAAESGGVDELIFDIALSRLRQPQMEWYSAKLAENNPDEGHWTYRRFVSPGTEGFRVFQPQKAENVKNLPDGYYERLRLLWNHRPDLQRRFIDGRFGFQQIGKAVTPEWDDGLHLSTGLAAIPRRELVLLWDFGLNPTCLITQVTPLGHWNIIESHVGEGIGVAELIEAQVKPALAQKYPTCPLRHIGDPQGNQREQSSSQTSAVKVIKKELGGVWRSGPVRIPERIQPLKAVLTRTVQGRGVVQVDPMKAKEVWFCLRGGWHYHTTRTGITGTDPVKNIHSHPGDAMGYGAAVLFPLGKLQKGGTVQKTQIAKYGFGGSTGLGFERPGLKLPREARG